MLQLIVATLPIIIVLNFILGFAILSRGFRDKINVLFGLMVLSVALWCFGILGFYLIELPPSISSGWIVLTHFSAALLSLIFLYFTMNFPVSIINRKYILFFPAIPFILITYYLFFTTNIIGNVFNNKYEINSGYIFYALYVLLYFIIGYLALFMQHKKALDVTQKIQIKYVFFGAVFSSTLATITDLIFPFLNIFEYTWLGPLFTSFLVISITYAILRHHLFNIRVVATELFTFIIWIILFVKTLLSKDSQDLLINGGLLFAMVIFGILLIRSVINEVRQREKIEKMAEDVKKAYEVEKKANDELKKLDEYKNNFMRQAQHDLRTPLTVMMGYSDLLLDGSYGKLPKQAADVIKRIISVTQGKLKDINNFLDSEQFKMGKGVVLLKPGVELSPILEEIMGVLNSKAKEKGISIKLEKSKQIFTINADREKLKSAIFNVIDNAVKYTTKGGVTIKTENHDSVKIIISDTGIGMPKDKIKNMLETQFERTKEAEKTASGSGVGLYLSGQIIKLHNGKIWAESEGEGKGTTFHIELPIEKK